MAENTVYKFYKDLPPWAKGVVVVGAGLVVYIVGRQVWKLVKPKSAQEQSNKQILQGAGQDVRDFEKQGQKQSYTNTQYEQFANTIYNGMRYCVGDDYGTVELTLKKMNNNVDVAKLIQAFGSRQDYCFGIPASGKLDLFTYVQKELGAEWGGLTNYRVRNVNADWARKGITYKI